MSYKDLGILSSDLVGEYRSLMAARKGYRLFHILLVEPYGEYYSKFVVFGPGERAILYSSQNLLCALREFNEVTK